MLKSVFKDADVSHLFRMLSAVSAKMCKNRNVIHFGVVCVTETKSSQRF